MHVQHDDNGNEGSFFIKTGNAVHAQLIYSMQEGDVLVAEHTEVDANLRHQNAGYEMVEAMVQYARKHQFRILPQCPFVLSVFEKKPAYADVWKKP